MIELGTIQDMRAWSRAQRARGRRIGLVPTMGYLHEGHLLLVDEARRQADDVVVSIFVNPLQFGPAEDFDHYPRDMERDRLAAAGRGVGCVFTPDVGEMYGEAALVRISPGTLADHLCGPHRPGHFEGVLTVVAKLFHAVEPDVAVFGRKDVQQATMIARMARDLNFPVDVAVIPTAREPDGLALSSRNTYLSPTERATAAQIPAALRGAHAAYARGARDAVDLVAATRRSLEAAGLAVEYVEAVDPVHLAPCSLLEPDTVVAVAARVGRTRLIDNVILGKGLGGDTIVGA